MDGCRCVRRHGPKGRVAKCRRDACELLGILACFIKESCRNQDLHRSGKHPGSVNRVVRLGEQPADRRDSRRCAPTAEPRERESWLRLVAELGCLPVSRLGLIELSAYPKHVTLLG